VALEGRAGKVEMEGDQGGKGREPIRLVMESRIWQSRNDGHTETPPSSLPPRPSSLVPSALPSPRTATLAPCLGS
jgi:hypothetical protein